MKNSHHIIAETARLKYEFDIRRNITIIQGDSATGKTTLIEMLRAYGNRGEESGVTLHSDVPCAVYGGSSDGWEPWIRSIGDSIVFIDEDYSFIQTEEFASCIRGTSNYYVLITRRALQNLPYSINEIYGIRTTGKYHFPHQIYHEFYQIYADENTENKGTEDNSVILITEDSGAGLQFFKKVCPDVNCISSNGNAGLQEKLLNLRDNNSVVIVLADGAAFGSFMERTLAAGRLHDHVFMYFPESFEWLILRSGIIDGNQIKEILEHPENYIESEQYFSWEQFFTNLLRQYTEQDPRMQYDKSKIGDYYTGHPVSDRILEVLPDDIRKLLRSD